MTGFELSLLCLFGQGVFFGWVFGWRAGRAATRQQNEKSAVDGSGTKEA